MPPKKGPPPKGQRSITSFVFSKSPAQPDGGAEGAAPAAAPAAAKKPKTAAHAAATTPVTAPQPLEAKPRGTAAVSVPAPPSTTTPTDPAAAAARRERWQAKLLGEGDGMGGGVVRQRVQTQDEVSAAAGSSKTGKLTPLETQVAALQKAHPDCILAIEVGYKFRFFGRDAEIASDVLGIFSYPDRHYLTASVPVATVDRHVRRLAMAGHKVGIVRQTESAAIKAASDSRNKPFERRLTAVYTRATLEAGELAAARPARSTAGGAGAGPSDGGGGDDDDGQLDEEREATATAAGDGAAAREDNACRSSYLVCVVEEEHATTHAGAVQLGIIAVETSTGEVLYSQVVDGVMRQELEARLMFAVPSELLLVTPLSSPTRRLLEALAGPGVRVTTVDGAKFASGGALATATDFYYGGASSSSGGGASPGDARVVTALPPLVLRALAHALDHLRPFHLESVLRLGAQFVDFSDVQEMALSPNALSQLEILCNSDDGRERGSLLWLMDRTKTAAGARLVRRWVSCPLRDVTAITARLDAVEELLRHGDTHRVLAALPRALHDLPDLERILGRVLHGTSSPPEFVTLLRSFMGLPGALELGVDAAALHQAVGGGDASRSPRLPLVATPGIESSLLSSLLGAATDPRCTAVAASTLAAIHASAAASGDLPSLFADDERFADVAERRSALAEAESALEAMLPSLARAVGLNAVHFVSVQNQGNYLVEVPIGAAPRAPTDWERVSTTKKVARFRPPAVKSRLATLEVERERLVATAKAAWRRLQSEFSEHYASFRAAIRALAALDCLVGFAALAAQGNYARPSFVDSPPTLRAVAARHPVLDVLLEGACVPNDIQLSGDGLRCAVITGPNMGGKSVYMRTAALLAIMAQAGCFVPAASLEMSAFDAVFTRMGAADSLSLGRSTFLEELAEMSTILSDATERSLVVIDELGRGTATVDGRAIAEAVMEHVVGMGCLTLFVTHYPEVAAAAEALGEAGGSAGAFRMAHVVDSGDNNNNGNGAPSAPKVTFLYKIERGVAASSFGLNVARMAGLPAAVVERAAAKAAEGKSGDGSRVERLAREAVRGLRGVLEEEGEGGEGEARAVQRQVGQAVLGGI